MKRNNRMKYLSKYGIGLDRFLFYDKYSQNNYLNPNIKNGLNSSKNIKNNQGSEILKKSSSQFFANKNNNKYFNKQDKSNNKNIKSVFRKNQTEQIRQIRKGSAPKLNYNIKPINNKIFNSSISIYKNNKKTKSVPKDNYRYKTVYDHNKNNNSSFMINKRVKTPILTRNDNDLKKNKDNKINKSKGLNENKSFIKNNNNIFQPFNIFSQFKRNKINNNEDLNKNNQLFKKLIEEQKNNIKNNESNSNLNNNNNINIIVDNKNIFNNNFNKKFHLYLNLKFKLMENKEDNSPLDSTMNSGNGIKTVYINDIESLNDSTENNDSNFNYHPSKLNKLNNNLLKEKFYNSSVDGILLINKKDNGNKELKKNSLNKLSKLKKVKEKKEINNNELNNKEEYCKKEKEENANNKKHKLASSKLSEEFDKNIVYKLINKINENELKNKKKKI